MELRISHPMELEMFNFSQRRNYFNVSIGKPHNPLLLYNSKDAFKSSNNVNDLIVGIILPDGRSIVA